MKLHRDVVSSGHLKMPRSDSSLAVGMFYSSKDAENLEREVKHRKSTQEFILLKPVSLLLQTMLAIGRENFFNVEM